MFSSKTATPDAYIAKLPPERAALKSLRFKSHEDLVNGAIASIIAATPVGTLIADYEASRSR